MGAAQTATGFLRPLQKVAGEHSTSTEALRTFGVQVGIALGESFSAGSTKRQVWTSSVSCGFMEELADEDLCVEARSIVPKLCESYATNVAYAAIKRVESTELLVSTLDEVLHRRTRVMGTNRVARRSESVCASVWSLGGRRSRWGKKRLPSCRVTCWTLLRRSSGSGIQSRHDRLQWSWCPI